MASNVERRSGQRFPIRMPVAYRLFLKEDRRVLSQGKGQTIDISHTGVLFNTLKMYPVGAAAEMLIEWPPGAEKIQVQLSLIGSVVRSDEHGTAVRILRHSFRSMQGEVFVPNPAGTELPNRPEPEEEP